MVWSKLRRREVNSGAILTPTPHRKVNLSSHELWRVDDIHGPESLVSHQKYTDILQTSAIPFVFVLSQESRPIAS